MKKILCKVVAIEPNFEDYGKEFFENLQMPEFGSEVVVERPDWYPFAPGFSDGQGALPRGVLPKDKNGKECGRSLYYTHLEQISII